jgi:gamma-glutamyltranspeptidase
MKIGHCQLQSSKNFEASPEEFRKGLEWAEKERAVGATVRDEPRQRGHKLTEVNSLGVSQAVARDPATGRFTGAHDPRVAGKAAGW